jgi:pimeloyl-ACP methyl ester carboxylesterase/ribosomal protein S18 acetylase RimI-like enzyme
VTEAPAERTASWLRRAEARDAAAVAEVYLGAFGAVYDFPLVHTADEVRTWIREVVVARAETWVVEQAPLRDLTEVAAGRAEGEIVGFMSLGDADLDQLYVRPGSWGRGHGGRLLALAMTRRPGGLELYTFQVNARARSFYERHGFAIVDLDDGRRNEERQPDVRYRWAPAAAATIEPSLRHVRSADGTPIGVFTTGHGPPVVLVHGATADHTTFRVVGPMLARHRTVHAVDRRGRGSSGDGPRYAIEREYEDIAAVIDAVAAGSGGAVDVVAHSFGGAVALGAATLTPNIRRLVVYESAAAVPGLDDPPADIVDRMKALERADDRAGLLRLFMSEVVGVDAAKLAEFEASPVYAERVAAAHTVLREMTAVGSPDAAAAMRWAAGVRIPVLQLLGGASRPFFRETTLLLDAALPDGLVIVLDGQRHAAHHDAPDVFVAEVEAFLGR